MIVVRVVRGISHHFTTRVGHWCCAAMVTHVGFILFTNPGYLERHDEMFNALTRVAPQSVWAWVCTSIGALRLAALVVNGTFLEFRYSAHLRAVTAMLTCFVWLQLALSLMAAQQETVVLGVVPYLLLFDIWNGYMAASEAAHTRGAGSNARGRNAFQFARVGARRG